MLQVHVTSMAIPTSNATIEIPAPPGDGWGEPTVQIRSGNVVATWHRQKAPKAAKKPAKK